MSVPRSRSRVRIALLGALASLVAVPALAAEPVSLEGDWFVIVHYNDSATANPEAERWEDKIWTFQRRGSRFHWTEYPIVVFDDRAGRFEARGKNARARALSFWTPNESQMAEIVMGPRINTRGSKSKGLRGDDEKGYRSTGGLRGQAASVVSYSETWSIDAPTEMPVFTRDDVMGTGRSARAGGEDESLAGRTRYGSLRVVDENVLVGEYSRDENRRGTFSMIRCGKPRGLPTGGKTPNEKAAERTRQAYLEGARAEIDRRLREGDEVGTLMQELRRDRAASRDRR